MLTHFKRALTKEFYIFKDLIKVNIQVWYNSEDRGNGIIYDSYKYRAVGITNNDPNTINNNYETPGSGNLSSIMLYKE